MKNEASEPSKSNKDKGIMCPACNLKLIARNTMPGDGFILRHRACKVCGYTTKTVEK